MRQLVSVFLRNKTHPDQDRLWSLPVVRQVTGCAALGTAGEDSILSWLPMAGDLLNTILVSLVRGYECQVAGTMPPRVRRKMIYLCSGLRIRARSARPRHSCAEGNEKDASWSGGSQGTLIQWQMNLVTCFVPSRVHEASYKVIATVQQSCLCVFT